MEQGRSKSDRKVAEVVSKVAGCYEAFSIGS